jgi:hypothetical protein
VRVSKVSQLLQRAVDELDADRALTDCGGDSLDAVRACVAHAKHAGNARLHQVRPPSHWPAGADQFFGEQGQGLEPRIERELARGQLRVVLEQYAPEVPGLFLYFPSRAQVSRLKAFVDVSRQVMKEK